MAHVTSIRTAGGPQIRDRCIGNNERMLLQISRWQQTYDQTNVEMGGGGAHVVMSLSQGQTVERHRRGGRLSRPGFVGSITVSDPEEVTSFSISGYADVVALYVPIETLEEVRQGQESISVRPLFAERDRQFEHYATMALAALSSGDRTDDLLLESLAFALGQRLVEGVNHKASGAHRGGLSYRAVIRVQELVETSLSTPMIKAPRLEDLASAAGLSVNHFLRSFRITFGETPHKYVLGKRLEQARMMLVTSDLAVANIGYRLGFASTAHFVATFRERMGVTPGAFRRAVAGD